MSQSAPIKELNAIGEWQSFSPGLERVKKCLTLLSHPERKWTHYLIGGTNGKGTVSLNLARALGPQTGLFLSPHLLDIRERITVDGHFLPDSLWQQSRDRILNLCPEVSLSFFEWLFVLSVEMFGRVGVQQAVYEVGMGGRLDATNALSPDVSVLTNVGLDHQAYLGETLEDIALEKIEIARRKKPFFVPENLLENPRILKRLKDIGCECYPFQAGGFSSNEPLVNQILQYLKLPELQDLAMLPGRREIHPCQPLLILDGAHNEPGWLDLAHWIEEKGFAKLNILFSVSKGRSPITLQKALKPVASSFFHWEAGFYQEVPGTEIRDVTKVNESGLKALIKKPLLVCGSLYFIAEFKKWLASNNL